MNPLRRLRLDLDVTVQELALAAGVHRDTIRRIENYEHTPTAPTIERLAVALAFLTGTGVRFDTGGLEPRLVGVSTPNRTIRADPLAAARSRAQRRRAGRTLIRER